MFYFCLVFPIYTAINWILYCIWFVVAPIYVISPFYAVVAICVSGVELSVPVLVPVTVGSVLFFYYWSWEVTVDVSACFVCLVFFLCFSIFFGYYRFMMFQNSVFSLFFSLTTSLSVLLSLVCSVTTSAMLGFLNFVFCLVSNQVNSFGIFVFGFALSSLCLSFIANTFANLLSMLYCCSFVCLYSHSW